MKKKAAKKAAPAPDEMEIRVYDTGKLTATIRVSGPVPRQESVLIGDRSYSVLKVEYHLQAGRLLPVVFVG